MAKRNVGGISRRDLFKCAGLGAGVAGVLALAGCNSGSGSTASSTSGSTSSNGGSSSNSGSSADSDFVTLETVEINPGRLLGFRERGVYNFRGIPYATAERFQNPVAISSYEAGTQNALIFGPVAPQDRTLSATGQVTRTSSSRPRTARPTWWATSSASTSTCGPTRSTAPSPCSCSSTAAASPTAPPRSSPPTRGRTSPARTTWCSSR